MTSSASVVARHPGRMRGTAPAAPLVAAVHVVVASVVTVMQASGRQRRTSPQKAPKMVGELGYFPLPAELPLK